MSAFSISVTDYLRDSNDISNLEEVSQVKVNYYGDNSRRVPMLGGRQHYDAKIMHVSVSLFPQSYRKSLVAVGTSEAVHVSYLRTSNLQ